MRAAMTRRTQVSSLDVPDNPEDLDSPEEIEAGSLTIKTSESESTPKELWERPVNYKKIEMPSDGSPLLRFEILSACIMPPEGEDPKVKRYVVYGLTLRLDTIASIDPVPARIQRRYTDFRELYNSLKQLYPKEMLNIEFPNKVLVGNFSSNLIAERGAAFEKLLTHISRNSVLRNTSTFLDFLQNEELTKACQLLDERNDACIPILENTFILLNKVFMDRSKPVLLLLCRLVAACTITPVPHQSAEKWASLALSRYETLCDIDLLPLYIPLLHTCAHLWWQRGRDQKPITDRLTDMSKKGININNTPTLMQAIHKLDPRSETI
ncbi:sorting nexin-21 isoform X4 [Lucilia cuprina]|uniref:sorting nexin-21 isoform X1 n=2 Tax=Lucilia cuprina TaxID=7375 RepID=UPI001F06C6E6|nr:sorting nexin-21 isoform X1 [Lucilia cuprina]XP_046812268.1 sorting nexin-21 isoform X2 [Lucilia cuprina]XP_046812269.1 sorting nexin-21 isoform X3 [Lucilia cuprina]XP_046812270.1 sorting nexin-21 isoform X4 [Lucilia cuprina]